MTTIPTSDSDADVLAFATYAFTTFTETASLSAMSLVVAPAWTRLDTAIDRSLSAGATQSCTGLLEGGLVAITTGSGVGVGGAGVAVGGIGVAVGGTGVAVGGTGVAVGGTGVGVGVGAGTPPQEGFWSAEGRFVSLVWLDPAASIT